jgi:DDE family transposase
LGGTIDSFGQHTAGDATYLNARPSPDPDAVAAEVAAGLPQPGKGRKEYTDADGSVTKVVEWFGYKLHLLVDVRHEVTLAYQITATATGDNEMVGDLLAQAQSNLAAGRIETLAYDKAADDGKVHELLQEADVKPLIQNRSLWPKDGEQEKTLGGRIPLHVVHDEAGTLFCYDTVSDPPVRRAMAYIGHEKERQTLKYRCPARHDGFTCASEEKCNAGKSYGMTVRVPQELDLRRFPPIPRATKQFERLYKGRTSVERVNARFKVFWGIDDGNVRGAYRFHAHVGAVLVVHAALATLLASMPRWEGGPLGRMQLSPIARALRAKAATASEIGASPVAATGT